VGAVEAEARRGPRRQRAVVGQARRSGSPPRRRRRRSSSRVSGWRRRCASACRSGWRAARTRRTAIRVRALSRTSESLTEFRAGFPARRPSSENNRFLTTRDPPNVGSSRSSSARPPRHRWLLFEHHLDRRRTIRTHQPPSQLMVGTSVGSFHCWLAAALMQSEICSWVKLRTLVTSRQRPDLAFTRVLLLPLFHC
jgi:hypothetical protein